MTTVKAWAERIASQWDTLSAREHRTLCFHHATEDELIERLVNPPKDECAYRDALVLRLPRNIKTIPTLPPELEEIYISGPVEAASRLKHASKLSYFTGHRINSQCLTSLPETVTRITLTCIDDPEFDWMQLARFTQIESLSIRHSTCPEKAFRALSPTLTSLDMRGVQLKDWSALSHLENLHTIEVGLTSFTEDDRKYLPSSVPLTRFGQTLSSTYQEERDKNHAIGQGQSF